MSDRKPSLDERVDSVVNDLDSKVTPFLDKYGLKIVIGFAVFVVIAAIVHRVL